MVQTHSAEQYKHNKMHHKVHQDKNWYQFNKQLAHNVHIKTSFDIIYHNTHTHTHTKLIIKIKSNCNTNSTWTLQVQ